MTDRYDRNGHEIRDGHPETVSKHAQAEQAQAHQDDYYDGYQDVATRQSKAYVFDDEREEQGPEWVYDEQRGVWVDRVGNPYVEAYPEGEEDRYAPAADDEYLAPRAETRMPRRKSRGSAVSLAALVLGREQLRLLREQPERAVLAGHAARRPSARAHARRRSR